MTQPLSITGLNIDLNLTAGRVAAVRDVDLSVGKGEIVCLVGESGSGKTITALAALRLLPRVAAMRAGEIVIDGTDVTRMPERDFAALQGRKMSIIFQNPMSSLNPVLTIGDQLTEAFMAHDLGSRAEARAKAVHLMERVGVPAAADRMNQYPHQLSGGLRQRVMIALALMCDPALVIGDEPTTALDVTMQAQTLRLLKDLVRDLDIGLLLITHDLGVVSRMADRVVVMYAGRIVEEGSCADIFAAPLHPYTKGLIDCAPAHTGGDGFLSIPGEVPALTARPKGCDFRNRCPSAQAGCGENIVLREAGARRWRCVMSYDEARAASSPAALAGEGTR